MENGRNYLSEWKLENLPRFVKRLRPDTEIAEEMTGNTRLFDDAPYVNRVVAVDPIVIFSGPRKTSVSLPRDLGKLCHARPESLDGFDNRSKRFET
jgi:hypothetical protein